MKTVSGIDVLALSAALASVRQQLTRPVRVVSHQGLSQ